MKNILFLILLLGCNSTKKVQKEPLKDVSVKLVLNKIDNDLYLKTIFLNNSNDTIVISKSPELFINITYFYNNKIQNYDHWIETEEDVNKGRVIPFFYNDKIISQMELINNFKVKLLPHSTTECNFSFNIADALKDYKPKVKFEYDTGKGIIMSDYLEI
jgi:hypothetical protein